MTPLTETQRLARDVDRRLAALPRERWPELVADAAVVLAGQWSATVDGKPACADCRRYASYGHVCSCPNRRIAKKLGAMVEAARIQAEAAMATHMTDMLSAWPIADPLVYPLTQTTVLTAEEARKVWP